MVATDTRSPFVQETTRTYTVHKTNTIKARLVIFNPHPVNHKYRVTLEVDTIQEAESIRDAASIHLIVAG